MSSLSQKHPAWDSAKIRADFPILHQTIYEDQPLIYLDNAATSQNPTVVIRALTDYYERTNANVHRALHYLGEQATAQFEEARAKVVRFIGATAARNVIFTRGTTESINLVAHAWGRAHLQAGDEILATGMEHHSNLVPWQLLARERGAILRLIPVLEDGTLDQEAYRTLLTPRVKLVAVTHTSNVLGTVNPIKEMAELAHQAGAVFLADGAQTVPQRKVDVGDLGCDFYAFSSHKICGPTGMGVLVVSDTVLETLQPFMAGGEMISRVNDDYSTWAESPYKFEPGTPNIAGAIAMGVAIDYLSDLGMDRIQAHEKMLTDFTISRLSEIPGLRIFGHAPDRGGAVSFALEGIHPHDLSQYVDQRGIAIRAGHLCAQPLMRRLGVPAVSRASVYLYNTPEEIDALVEAILQAQHFFDHG